MNDHTKSLLQALIDGKELERLYSEGGWRRHDGSPFQVLYGTPHKNLRVKQPTIRIGEVDVPLRVAPAKGTRYWIVDAASVRLSYPSEWGSDNSDLMWLNRGLVHLSKEAASAHSKALIAVSWGTI